MNEAALGGRAVSLDEAIEAAVALLRASRNPVIAGLDTDYAGAEAAVELARVVGGAFDHGRSTAALRDLDVMRRAGWIVTTPLQASARADVVLFVGDTAAAISRLDTPPPLATDRPRHVIHLDANDAAGTIGILRALIGKRPLRADPRIDTLREHAAALTGARFGVAVWSARELDDLVIEMLCGLIDDLNKTTRFAGLPLDAGANAGGVIQAAAQRCGFPVRIGFARGFPEHDPWRFDAVRMVESGEADAVVWIASTEPPWRKPVKTVTIATSGTAFATPPDVSITVGQPGRDHDAVLFRPALGALGFVAATSPTPTPCAAEILARIASAC